MSFEDAYSLDFDVATIDISGGAKIKVRRLMSEESQRYRRTLMKPYRNMQTLPPQVEEDVLTKQLAGAVLVGWEGVTEGGAAVPFSRENAERLMKKFPLFREDVIAAASAREAFQAERDAEIKGN